MREKYVKELIHVSQDELTKIEGSKTPKCKYCGKSIWYENTKISFNKNGTLASMCGGTTYRSKKKMFDDIYHVCVCQKCLEKKYPDFSERNVSKIFNTFNKYVAYAFGIPEDIIKERNLSTAVSLDNFIKKYGEEEGRKRFETYKDKQAQSNTFEYKHEKYGWTKDEFDEFNKSRSVTLENLIRRHGEDEGKRIWKQYCEKQSYTSTKEYLYDTFGEEEAIKISLCKAHNLDGFIAKYGQEKGTEIYNNYISNTSNRKFYSNLSKTLFDEVCERLSYEGLKFDNIFYGENEYWKLSKETKKIYYLDFYIPDIKFVVELNGDYWHCNPDKYEPDYIHTKRHLTAQEIWDIDDERKQILNNEFGCFVMFVWEHDVKQNKDKVINDIISRIKERIWVIRK